ncbi:MAG: TrmH family RNA methyltransferase [Candidatus Moraniibacteriota bacterium]
MLEDPGRKSACQNSSGAEESLPWEYREDPVALIGSSSTKVFRFWRSSRPKEAGTIGQRSRPVPSAFGREAKWRGVPQTLLALCDAILEIPMRGEKNSLNVSVALGVALYQITATMKEKET